MRSGNSWLAVETNFAPRLIVGWRPRPRELAAALVELHEDTFDDLRLVAQEALETLATADAIPFEHEALPEEREEYIRRSITDLPSANVPDSDSDDSGNDGSAGLIKIVKECDQLPGISAGQLSEGDFAFYGIAYSQTDSEMVGFIRAISPIRAMRKAAFWGRFSGSLRRVEKPDLMLDSEVDIVVTADELAILRRSAYDRLFSDLDELAAAVPQNVSALAEAMPLLGLTDDAKEVLNGLGTELRSVAKRLNRLHTVEGLSSLTPTSLREALQRHGEDSLPWFNEADELTLDRARAKEFIDLVEGRWWTSDFQQERRRADRFRRR